MGPVGAAGQCLNVGRGGGTGGDWLRTGGVAVRTGQRFGNTRARGPGSATVPVSSDTQTLLFSTIRPLPWGRRQAPEGNDIGGLGSVPHPGSVSIEGRPTRGGPSK